MKSIDDIKETYAEHHLCDKCPHMKHWQEWHSEVGCYENLSGCTAHSVPRDCNISLDDIEEYIYEEILEAMKSDKFEEAYEAMRNVINEEE